jgi:hypothetical protein
VVINLVSGLFALGGVAVAALFSEIRSRREDHSRQSSELVSLKRKTYANALYQVELVASNVAQWVDANDDDSAARSRAVWDSLTTAYQIVNEIHIMARTQEPAVAMKRMLTAYRTPFENGERKLPKPRDLRADMIGAFRRDLGLSP